jgi:hypothetical protein
MTMQLVKRVWILPAALTAVGLAPNAEAQSVATRQLTRPEAEFADPFTQIAAVRELKSGRVLVVDPRDKIVQLLDFKAGSAVKVGREGQGPGEYSLPMALVALPGDSSAIFDPLNQRYLVVDPNGKPAGFLSTRAAGDDDERRDAGANRGGPMMRMGRVSMTPPRGTDRSGNIYVAGAPFRIGPDGPVSMDSAPVQRFNRAKKSYETVAHLKLPKNNAQVSGGGGRVEVRIGGANPFAPRDEWAVAPDGRIAIVHAADYRVEWIAPNGQRTLGPVTSYAKTKVTEKHKTWWQENQRRRGTALMITNNNGRTSATAGPPPSAPQERNDWPEYLPPFLVNAAQVAPNGELWVLQASASDDAAPTYDVFDGAGKLTARVQLAKRSRVVGFGSGSVYVARFDEDDLQYLQRYRLQ